MDCGNLWKICRGIDHNKPYAVATAEDAAVSATHRIGENNMPPPQLTMRCAIYLQSK
jgi:hypothetical protein